MNQLDGRASLVWLGAGLATLFILDHPAVDLLVIAAAGANAYAAGSAGPFRILVLVGVSVLIIRTILYSLTGHTGDHVLFVLPQVELPVLLGGATLGGRVTAEVVLTGAVEGLRFTAVAACFGAFLASTTVIEVIRLLPRFVFEAGLVLNIAMAFVPQLARSARGIREAQKMRGAGRSPRPAVIPLLASALERATSLAEAMDSRGYGRASFAPQAKLWRRIAAASTLFSAASLSLWLMKSGELFFLMLTLGSLAVLALSLARLSRSVPRTRYRARRWTERENLVVASAGACVAFAVALSIFGAVGDSFDVYRALRLPDPHWSHLASGVLLGLPGLMFLFRRGPA